MYSIKFIVCKSSLLGAAPSTPVDQVPGYGNEETHGTRETWLRAWVAACNLSWNDEVLETIDECMRVGESTRLMVSGEFREKVYRISEAMGLFASAFTSLDHDLKRGFANLSVRLPPDFVWVVPDFARIERIEVIYRDQKLSKIIEHFRNLSVLDEKYPRIRDMIVERGARDCQPWGRCLCGYGMCSFCMLVDNLVTELPLSVRRECESRLVDEGVVQKGWMDGVPVETARIIDRFS